MPSGFSAATILVIGDVRDRTDGSPFYSDPDPAWLIGPLSGPRRERSRLASALASETAATFNASEFLPSR